MGRPGGFSRYSAALPRTQRRCARAAPLTASVSDIGGQEGSWASNFLTGGQKCPETMSVSYRYRSRRRDDPLSSSPHGQMSDSLASSDWVGARTPVSPIRVGNESFIHLTNYQRGSRRDAFEEERPQQRQTELPAGNLVLARIPPQDLQGLQVELERVMLKCRQIPYQREKAIQHVSFPLNCLISPLATVDKRRVREVGMTGMGDKEEERSSAQGN